MRPVRVFFLALAMLGTPFPATAGDKESPVRAELSFELQSDWVFHSQDTDEERLDTFVSVEAAISVSLQRGGNLAAPLSWWC